MTKKKKKKRGFRQRNHLDDYHPSCNHPSGVNHALTVHFSFRVRNQDAFPSIRGSYTAG